MIWNFSFRPGFTDDFDLRDIEVDSYAAGSRSAKPAERIVIGHFAYYSNVGRTEVLPIPTDSDFTASDGIRYRFAAYPFLEPSEMRGYGFVRLRYWNPEMAYVGMTRHREDVEVYAGRDDFKSFDGLKERLSRARPKDSTLDYAQRRGLEAERTDDAETGRPEQKGRQRNPVSVREASAPYPIARFKAAQKEFIQVAGIADFDPNAKARAAELREVMKQTSQEIAKDSARMRAAAREGIAPQVRNFVRQAENELGREKGRGLDRDEGQER